MKSDALLAITGDYEFEIELQKVAVLEGLREGMISAATWGKEELRKDVRRAGLGNRLANSWRFEKDETLYPTGGRLSYNPSATIFSNAPHIIGSYDRGELIQPGKGKFLAIPIPGSPAEKIGAEKSGNKRPSKLATARRKWGDKLQLIPAKGNRPAMIVLHDANVRANGRVSTRKRTKKGNFKQDTRTVFLFWLIPQARVKKRLNVARISEHIRANFSDRVALAMSRKLREVQQ